MTSIVHTFQKTSTLPVSNTAEPPQQSIRRRLSSLSLNIQPIAAAAQPAASWALHRSKSLSSMGEMAGTSLRRWWDMGWSWIISKKPVFAQDLEMNGEETRALGCHNKGSWGHVFYKVRSEIRRLVGSDNVGLPQTYRYDSLSRSVNGSNRFMG